jgi:hypothetical protein
VAALLYYKKFMKSLTKQGYKTNPYDGCVANKMVKGKQITICFHVDDCKISHESSKVIDDTIDWLRAEYESRCIAGRYTNTLACCWTSLTRVNVVYPCMIMWIVS